MTGSDHHYQNALELYAVGHLQYLAESRGIAKDPNSSPALIQKAHDSLATNGYAWSSIQTNPRASSYLKNLEDGSADILTRLEADRPGSRFNFHFMGREGRLARRKGDIEIHEYRDPDHVEYETHYVSLKNYEQGCRRIQVGSGTFQSFALGFILSSKGVGKWYDPTNQSTCSSSHRGFATWRDEALRRHKLEHLIPEFHALDELNRELKSTFLDSEEFRLFDSERVAAERQRVGTAGAEILYRILTQLTVESVFQHVLKSIGFDGSEDLLVFGKGKIADTLTDPEFALLITRARQSRLVIEMRGQCILLTLVDGEGDEGVVLSIQIPCTINTNGAWYRDGEPYEGTRYHPKEKKHLAWGERRPKKSRQIATSINTYLDLGATGVLRDLPSASECAVAA